MKILFISPDFYPSVGGVEQMVLGLASYLHNETNEITILTRTKFSGEEPFKMKVIRNYSTIYTFRTIQNFNIIVLYNLSLKRFLPYLISSKPLIIVHGGKYTGWSAPIKKWISYFRASEQISCSNFVANKMKSTKVIPNFYRNDIFYNDIFKENRSFDIVYVGRLVPEKGCGILLYALNQLRRSTIKPKVLIVGSGPEEFKLKKLSIELKMNDQINFVGIKTDEELRKLLNQSKTLVVPSIVEEGFGIVALEGIACGCMVIGTEHGGLKEAIGPCGMTVPNGNVDALAEAIKKIIMKPELIDVYQKHADEHLKKHTLENISVQYRELISKIVEK